MSHWSTCARCRAKRVITIMSRFNTDIICGPCETLEKAHPRYAEAWEAELAEVKKGNMNFPGIGLPADLVKQVTDTMSNGNKCAKCGKVGAAHYSPIALYSGSPGNRPEGEWLCAEGNSMGPSSREAWACHYRAQKNG